MNRHVLKATPALLGLAALLGIACSAAAQQPRRVQGPTVYWGSLYIVAYPGIGHFYSPVGPSTSTANQTWNFGSGVGLGLAASHMIGSAAQIGIDASLAPSVGTEITDTLSVVTSGHARLGEAMVTGRVLTGGGGGLALFLTGGLGAIFFGMPAPASSATDFAYRYGGGLEYKFTPRRAAFLEWGSIGAFHKHHGVSSNTIHFSQLRGGVRIGW